MAVLSQRRAADRAIIAQRVRGVAERHGFTATVEKGALDPHETRVIIHAARGLNCSMSFQREAEGPRGWGFIGHWFITLGSPARLALSFGDVNPFHQCKATLTAGSDFEPFLQALDGALAVVARGEAWDAEREVWEKANPEVARAAGSGAAYQAFRRAQDRA